MRRHFFILVLVVALVPLYLAAQPTDAPMSPPTETRPWVGVVVSPAPSALRSQLKLPQGIGLIVEFVQPKSPAADAGLKPYDLLVKLDDQWLVNPEQFAVLVRMHHAGDEVKLHYLREAAEHTATAKLVEHEFSRLPEWNPNPEWNAAPARVPTSSSRPGDSGPTRVLTCVDGHHQVSMTTTNDRTTLVVKDIDTGRVVFDGPIDTEEQRKSLPPDVRRMLDSLEKISSDFGVPTGRGDKPPAARDERRQSR